MLLVLLVFTFAVRRVWGFLFCLFSLVRVFLSGKTAGQKPMWASSPNVNLLIHHLSLHYLFLLTILQVSLEILQWDCLSSWIKESQKNKTKIWQTWSQIQDCLWTQSFAISESLQMKAQAYPSQGLKWVMLSRKWVKTFLRITPIRIIISKYSFFLERVGQIKTRFLVVHFWKCEERYLQFKRPIFKHQCLVVTYTEILS